MSKGAIIVPPETKALQAKASDPTASAWVTANAGSGKTTVLVRRMLRLMLSDVKPERILALTFTKAAAANMANRLLDLLAGWVPLDDASLDAELVKVLDRPPTQSERLRARQLFAEALETPGGLKIQTLHAFCTSVLQSAPFEAGIPAHFEVISDTDRAAAIEAAISRTLNRASADGSDLKISLDRIAEAIDDQRFRDLIDKALAASAFLVDADGEIRSWDDIRFELAKATGADPAWTRAVLEAEAVAEIERCLDVKDMVAAVEAYGSPSDREKWAKMSLASSTAKSAAERLQLWTGAFLTTEFKIRDKQATANVLANVPSLVPRIEAAVAALVAAREKINTFDINDLSVGLFGLTRLILADYEATKRRASVLDYGDLIARTRALFEDGKAAWVLYKLDAGLDHLLIDEAQDTSADQWVILNALTVEFLSGHGQRPDAISRTIFAVGDEKQSIFGFQGAEPAAFGAQRRDLAARFATPGRDFHDTRLKVSFRSTLDIIKAVDAVFAQAHAFKGLSSDDTETGTTHETVRGDASGAVDLWDLFEADSSEDEVVWRRPVDAPDRSAPVVRMARAIAGTIRRWMDEGRDDLGRAFNPADVLILLPKRKAAFGAIVRALKDVGVPVAGMDRLTLSTHIAVEDLIALGRAVLLPDDDLTLAVVLKGPFIGLVDDDLLRLAPHRKGSLRRELETSTDPRDVEALFRLRAIEASAGSAGPFGFFSHVLSVLGGRKRMLARLGPEAADAIDAFLLRALDHEQREGPSLSRFLSAIEASADDVKRDLAVAAGEVRVMTVHGAKGLEASIVFIADIGMPPTGQRIGPLLDARLPGSNRRGGVTIWARRANTDNAVAREARDHAKTKETEEFHRLLYVAMTRAENHLILCGVKPANSTSIAQSWYGLAESGLKAAETALAEVPATGATPALRRFKVTPDLPFAEQLKPSESEPHVADLPGWVALPAATEQPVLPPLSPSNALAAADRQGRSEEQPTLNAADLVAAERGRFAHLLLQWLPGVEAARRGHVAGQLAERHARSMSATERTDMIAEVLAVMARDDLQALFGPESLGEPDIGGEIMTSRGPRAVSGRVDRLVVTDTEIVLADFKTTWRPPSDPAQIAPGTLAQLAVYRALLAELYPERPIRALVIFTAGPVVIEPGAAQLDQAMSTIGSIDVTAA